MQKALPRQQDAAVATPRRSVRLHELDGLRGWAALSVVLFHIFWETFGLVVPGFRNPVTAVLFDGEFAVAIFFVLSGEALSAAYFAGRGEAAVFKLAVRRYSRLTLPIVATCAIILILVNGGWTFNHPAATVVGRQDWLGQFLTAPATIPAYARYALVSVYLPDQPLGLGVPFLWTMHYEMLGSFVVFAVLLAYRHVRFAFGLVLVAAMLILVGHGSVEIACFLAGLAFSEARQAGVFRRIHQRALWQVLSWAAVLLLAAMVSAEHMAGLLRDRLPLAIPLVFAIFSNKTLCGLFASGPSRWLGTLSFPLYLVQFPVLVSFTSWAIVRAADGGLTQPEIWGISLASLALVVAGAVLFLPVERATQWVGDQTSRRLLPEPPR